MAFLLITASLYLVCSIVSAAFHPHSPCPSTFTYFGSEPKVDRWYGNIELSTDNILYTVTLEVQFDRPVDLLVSWLGEVTTTNNEKFTILSLSQKLLPEYPINTRFLVKYDSNRGSPQIQTIYLNKKQICPQLPDNVNKPNRRPDPTFEEHSTGQNLRPSYGEDNQKHHPTSSNNNYPYSNNNNNKNINNNNNNNGQVSYVNPLRQPPSYNTGSKVESFGSASSSSSTNYEGVNYNVPTVISNESRQPNYTHNHNIIESGVGTPNIDYGEQTSSFVDNSNKQNTDHFSSSSINYESKPSRPNYTSHNTTSSNNVRNNTKQSNSSKRTTSTKKGNNTATASTQTVNYTNSHSHQGFVNKQQADRYNNRNMTTAQATSPLYGEEIKESVDDLKGECGLAEENRPLALIVNGQSTYKGQWPWQVAISKISTGGTEFICGGTLITLKTVLTAAHCVTRKLQESPVDTKSLAVYLGKFRSTDVSEDDGVQSKQIRTIHVYPRYNSSTFLGDIALLILTNPARLTRYVQQCCLWNRIIDESVVGKNGIVVGWGLDEREQLSSELKMGKMFVVNRNVCVTSYESYFSHYTSDNTLCAGNKEEASACNGDSGGGLFFNKNSRWYVRGIVSNTVARGDMRICDTRHYVVFTDVAKYLDWINNYKE